MVKTIGTIEMNIIKEGFKEGFKAAAPIVSMIGWAYLITIGIVLLVFLVFGW